MTSQDSSWISHFHEVVEYKRAHGHCNVPRKVLDVPRKADPSLTPLGDWVARQRVAKRNNKLNAEREAKLNAIGFVWSLTITKLIAWDDRFKQLEDYKSATGDCNVSKSDSQNIKLGYWVVKQRKLKKECQLSKEREAKLNSIGFVWRMRCTVKRKSRAGFGMTAWDTRFEQLKEYTKANGDCNVSQYDSENVQLGRWTAKQRIMKKSGRLSKEHEAKLNSIIFVWNGYYSVDWDTRFQQLLEYKVAFGDCDVPQSFLPHPTLGGWVRTQRKRANSMAKERRLKLDSIGFDWKKRKPRLETTDNENCWDVHFRELLAYLQTHGDFNVPQCYPCNPLLARWVSEQRNIYDLKLRGEQTSLTPLREAKLDAIGFTWSVVGGTGDAPAEGIFNAVRPEEVRSESKVRSETAVSVSRPDRITISGY